MGDCIYDEPASKKIVSKILTDFILALDRLVIDKTVV